MVAANVYGGTITSSPGPTPRALSEVSSAVVPLAVATHPMAPTLLAQASSKRLAYLPSRRHQRPPWSTSIHAFSSLEAIFGQDGKGSVRTGLPPSNAGLALLAAKLEAGVGWRLIQPTQAATRVFSIKPRRVELWIMIPPLLSPLKVLLLAKGV